MNGVIYLTLDEYLENHDLTAHKLAQKVEGHTRFAGHRVARGSIYALAKGDVKRFDLGTLSAVMDALEELTGKSVTFDDLLEHSSAGTATILEEHPDIKERIARLERGEAKLIPWEEALERLERDTPVSST